MTNFSPMYTALMDSLARMKTTPEMVDLFDWTSDTPDEPELSLRNKDDDGYILDFNFPGYERSDISLEIDGGDLVVAADEVKTVNEEFDRPALRMKFELMPNVEVVSATYERDVLSVELRKHALVSSAKQIPIK